MRLWKRLTVASTSLIAATLVLTFEAGAQQRDHPQQGVRHGRDLSATLVGPAAAGVPPGVTYGGQTIRDETAAPFLRKIATTARYDGFTVAGPHLLIEGATFTGALDIYAKQPLVLRGVSVRIAGASYWAILSRQGAGSLYVLWSEAGGTVAPQPTSGPAPAGVQRGLYLESDNAVVYRSHVSHAADGIQVHAPGARVIETLVDDLITWAGEHNDGIQLIGRGERLTVQRSRILNPNPQTSCILLQRSGHVIEDSYLSGGGWVLYGAATAKAPDILPARDLRVSGTIFGQEYGPKGGTFGPVADWDGAPATGNIWRDNRFADGRPVEPGRKVGP